MSDCLHQSLVEAYHDGRLAPGERMSFEAHLSRCAECNESLSALQSLSRWLQSEPRPRMTPAFRQHLHALAPAAAPRTIVHLMKMLTGAAASILVAASFGLLHARPAPPVAAVPPAPWEQVALAGDVSPDGVADATAEHGDLRFANWVASDLSERGRNGQN